MKPTLNTYLAIAAATLLLLSGCSTSHVRPMNAEHAANGSHFRGPAAADEPLIEKFVDALADHSSMASQDVEDAVTQVVNDNASRLNISRIDSLDDIASMSDADQRRIIKELAKLPELSEKLSLDSEAVNVARGEAMAAQDVKDVTTQAVPDLRGDSDAGSNPGFTKVLERAPELKGDVAIMEKEASEIEQKTGTAVLGKGCDSITNTDSVENLATMIAGVDRDVAAGKATDTPTVAKSLEKNMDYVLGTDDEESHARICTLSDANQCAVFSPKMCN